MNKIGLPTGLIRFSSQAALEKTTNRLIRARTVIYPLLLVGVLAGFVIALGSATGFTVNIIRGTGSIYTPVEPDKAMNRFRLKLTNRTRSDQEYSVAVRSPEGAVIQIVDQDQLRVGPNRLSTVDVSVVFPRKLTAGTGNFPAIIDVLDSDGIQRQVNCKLLGPNN